MLYIAILLRGGMIMKELLIPYALVNGKVKTVKKIDGKDKDNITCLHCGEKLILKAEKSDCMRKHLSHYSDSKCDYLSKETMAKANIHESYEHKYIKFFLRDNLEYFREKYINMELKDGELKLAGYRDLQILNILVEKELVKGYIPDLTIITPYKTICLEIYRSNKKNLDNLNGKLGIIPISVYEVDINDIDLDDTIENIRKAIFKKMKLIYSDVKSAHSISVEALNESIIKRHQLENQHKQEILNLENKINSYEKRFDEKEWQMDRLGSENMKLREEIAELKASIGEKPMPRNWIEAKIKKVALNRGNVYIKIANKKNGEITLMAKDCKYYDFFIDMIEGQGHFMWDENKYLISFVYKQNLLGNKNHIFYKTNEYVYERNKLFKIHQNSTKKEYIAKWNRAEQRKLLLK